MKSDAIWYRKCLHPVAILLLPFAWMFSIVTAIRRFCYRSGLFKTYHFSVPVIVVGNLTVGGTGKTPFVIWLAQFLQTQGFKPGIVSRGIGGKKHILPHRVNPESSVSVVGDEALMLAKNTDCPMVIAVNRVAAVRELLKQDHCNIVISDDGLQHYRLGRAMEIVMIDSERSLGNRCLLPAGPLREPASRLQTVDMVVMHGGDENDTYTMSLEPMEFVSVVHAECIPFATFPRNKIHAIAGIGHPQRFFKSLVKAGFDLIEHIFPDHHAYQPRDLDFADKLPIVMTEKDAVKCVAFADARYWYVRVRAKVNAVVESTILEKLNENKRNHCSNNIDPVQYSNTRCEDR